MPWQSNESPVWPWKLRPLFIHVSACRCWAEMRNRAPGGSEGCTSNEETQAIFPFRGRLMSRFAFWVRSNFDSVTSGHLASSPWVLRLHQVTAQSCCVAQYGETMLPLPAFIWWAKGLRGTSGPTRVSQVWSGVTSLAPLSPVFPAFVWLCSPCAPRRQPRGERGKGRGERESCSSSHLCQALRLSSSGSLLCLHCFPRCLELQLPGAHRYHWGGSAYDVLIIRFAITSGREDDLLLLSKLRKRE